MPNLGPESYIVSQIISQNPTFLIFSDYSMPVTFYNDHYDPLRYQNFLFTRKISPEASGLKTRLLALYQSPQSTCQISDDGSFHNPQRPAWSPAWSPGMGGVSGRRKPRWGRPVTYSLSCAKKRHRRTAHCTVKHLAKSQNIGLPV